MYSMLQTIFVLNYLKLLKNKKSSLNLNQLSIVTAPPINFDNWHATRCVKHCYLVKYLLHLLLALLRLDQPIEKD